MPDFYPRAVGMDSWTLDGDSGTSQSITDGQTATIAGGTGLTSAVGATDTVTITLDDTAVTPAAYTAANITVDQQGRITAAASGDAATKALDNLASVQINTTLLSDAHNTDDLGTDAKSWRTLYLSTSLVFDQTTRNLTITASEPGTAARTVNFGDPGANESVAYLATSQAFTNKTYNGVTVASAANTFSLTVGSGSLDIAATKTLDVNEDLTVSATCTLDQDLQQSTSPTFVGLTLSGAVAGASSYESIVLASAANTFSFTVGSASLDVAATKTVDIDDDFTVESASLVNQDLTTDAVATFAGVISSGAAGYDASPGSDIDTDIITVNVTGTPKIDWDESEDNFRFNKGIQLATGGNIRNGEVNAKRTMVLTAAGGYPTSTAGCSTPTQVEAATNDVNYWTLDFDTATDEHAFWVVTMPDEYDDGTITFRLFWTNAGGGAAETVSFDLKARAYADSDAIDQAWGDAITVNDTWLAQGDVHISAVSGALTIGGGAAGGELVAFDLMRDITDDDLTGDARILAVHIEYGISAYSS